MVLAGTGFLLPYNSFVSAVDFYKVGAILKLENN